MNTSILEIKLTQAWGVEITVGPVFFILLLAIAGIMLFRLLNRNFRKHSSWQTLEMELSIGNIGKVKIKPSYEIIRVAHQAWTELATRKAGLLFDKENDVISEVYDSWYEIFKQIRSLIKSIPAEEIKNSKDAQVLVDLLVDVLNKGLRPHLTQWQARFRHWYLDAQKNNGATSPQLLQQKYPEYDLLVADLIEVNKQLVEFSDVLKSIAHE
jgi:hypothetical protein